MGDMFEMERFAMLTSWRPHFKTPEVETAYLRETIPQNIKRAKIVARLCSSIIFFFVFFLGLTGQLLSSRLLENDTLGRFFFPATMPFVIWLSPQKYFEHATSAFFFCWISFMLVTNDFRLKRLGLVSEVTPIEMNEKLLESCDLDGAEVAREPVLLLAVMFIQVVMYFFIRIRSGLTIFFPVGLSIVYSALIFPFTMQDHVAIFALFTFSNFTFWYQSRLNELDQRKIWELLQRADESRSLEQLVDLMFPVVIQSQNACITRKLKVFDQFGVDVTNLEDLVVQTEDQTDEKDLDLVTFVRTIESSNSPIKRNMTVCPQGAMNKFKCTVCGVPLGVRGASLLGIEIHETWPIMNGSTPKMQSDPFRSPLRVSSRLSEHSAEGVSSTKLTEIPREDLSFIEPEVIFQHSIDRPYPARLRCDRVDIWFRDLFPEVTLDMTFDERIIKDTKKEASILFALRHPAIITAFGTTVYVEGPALVLEPSFCSVASALESGPKSKPFGVRVASQIASAVQYLHGRRIFHNAIEAETVLLLHGSEKDPIAKLTNFAHATRNNRDSGAAIKDIESLGGFISLLFRGEADELESAIDDPDCNLGWEALHRYYEKIFPLIRGTSGWDKLSAQEIAFEFARLDTAVEVGSVRIAAWLRSTKETKFNL
jgi:hypothetical protein